MSHPAPDLDDRYGRSRPWQRPVLITVSVLLAALFGGWLAWTAWFHSTPEVRSALIGYEVQNTHEVTARVEVQLRNPRVQATCKVRAYSADKSTVGELNFDPAELLSGREGSVTVTIRTERMATSVEKIGCTTPDQRRPR